MNKIIYSVILVIFITIGCEGIIDNPKYKGEVTFTLNDDKYTFYAPQGFFSRQKGLGEEWGLVAYPSDSYVFDNWMPELDDVRNVVVVVQAPYTQGIEVGFVYDNNFNSPEGDYSFATGGYSDREMYYYAPSFPERFFNLVFTRWDGVGGMAQGCFQGDIYSVNTRQSYHFEGCFSAEIVRRQMVVDKFDKKLRNTFYSLRSFMYHFSHNSQSTILCPS